MELAIQGHYFVVATTLPLRVFTLGRGVEKKKKKKKLKNKPIRKLLEKLPH
jgi:hypothetical protein